MSRSLDTSARYWWRVIAQNPCGSSGGGADADTVYTDGFDGLPVPSPDGRQLAWTSTRAGGDQGQLYLAQWNHEKALEAIRNAPPRQPSKKS